MDTPGTYDGQKQNLPNTSKRMRSQLEWLLITVMSLAYVAAAVAQNGLNDLNFQAQSEFQPTIKDAIKFSDLPEISDSVKRIGNIQYGINSKPLFPKYEVLPIDAAKLQNEPLPKLYKSLLKIGYGPIYNMPFGEFRISNTRSRDNSFGAYLKHFSSDAQLDDVGYSGFSDNTANVFGKRFYKKHTLSGDLLYERNVVHYYGFDTTAKQENKDLTRQRYQLIEPTVRLQSHYTDSTHLNHDIKLGFYNYTNLDKEAENNVRLNALGSLFVNKEKLNIGLLTDYYNHKQAHDTVNDLIVSLSPSFEAHGKKWNAEVGVTGTLDNFRNDTRFYFYPLLHLNYDVYEGIIVPYAGVTGGLIKNSFRSLSRENPFVDTTLHYLNTHNKVNLFGGLRGNLSSNTSYDARVSYSQLDSLYFFVNNYHTPDGLDNTFFVVYDNATLLTVTGEVQYKLREKLNIIGKGNYYMYQTDKLQRAYHKPDFDMTLSAIYNLKSKVILRADLFIMGKQWAHKEEPTPTTGITNLQIDGWGDMNLEAEYRYSKMMSFFVRLNNIANQRYYRWQQYPSQKFNFMLGLTFVPF